MGFSKCQCKTIPSLHRVRLSEGGWVKQNKSFTQGTTVRVLCENKSHALTSLKGRIYVTVPSKLIHTQISIFFSKPDPVALLPEPNHDRFATLIIYYNVLSCASYRDAKWPPVRCYETQRGVT